ncbi:hypothetical protein ACRARG_12640 [Pseudooceanicola sp. C21-150M6]|uniref:hypothetical protein n=1 Tax=Pseudooceanicola sp. C21-150M6 TaxID=3434355 RepID=UPI003D7F18F0
MTDGEKHEANRQRVRRFLIGPLQALGFRFKKGTPIEEERKRLAQIADDVGYLTDQNLDRLYLALRDKGEGSARCFWPARATIIAFAQAAQPRPIEDMPGLASWFASEAGRRAEEDGRLVAEYRFWTVKHRPPLNDRERDLIAKRARQWASEVDVARDRLRRDVPLRPGEEGMLHAYEIDEAAARELVRGSAGREDAA